MCYTTKAKFYKGKGKAPSVRHFAGWLIVTPYDYSALLYDPLLTFSSLTSRKPRPLRRYSHHKRALCRGIHDEWKRSLGSGFITAEARSRFFAWHRRLFTAIATVTTAGRRDDPTAPESEAALK